MKRFLSLPVSFFAVCMLASANLFASLPWMASYDDAVQASQSSSKPMFLFFTGSDWCSWCMKLENEALNTPEFANAAGGKFIFVKIDFPNNQTQAKNISEQNKQLQKKYGVRGFPTVVILDAKQKQIGSTGYKAGGGQKYAEHVLQMIKN